MSSLDDDINRKIDNGLKRKELEKKYSGDFSEEGNLSPETEREWLNYVEQFEEQFAQHKTIKVWDYLGQPAFKKLDEIPPEMVEDELEKLLEIMAGKQVGLDALSDVEPAELYRFIIEELFEHEMSDIRIEGMFTNFIYEEFHPNAKLDIEQAYDYFLNGTLSKYINPISKNYDMLYVDTKNFYDAEGKPVEEKQVVKRISNFLDSFDSFEIVSAEIDTFEINEDESDALITSNIHFNGCISNFEPTEFKGKGLFKLKPSEYGGWDIYHFILPGLEV